MKLIFQLIDQSYPSKKKKKYYLIKKNIIFKKILNKKSQDNNISFIILEIKKINFLKLLKMIFILNKSNKIYKNFVIFFNFKKEVIAYNIIPDWPSYKSSNFFFNFLFWLKKIILIFFKFKFINYIALQLR